MTADRSYTKVWDTIIKTSCSQARQACAARIHVSSSLSAEKIPNDSDTQLCIKITLRPHIDSNRYIYNLYIVLFYLKLSKNGSVNISSCCETLVHSTPLVPETVLLETNEHTIRYVTSQFINICVQTFSDRLHCASSLMTGHYECCKSQDTQAV
jgi:hypothetical protein